MKRIFYYGVAAALTLSSCSSEAPAQQPADSVETTVSESSPVLDGLTPEDRAYDAILADITDDMQREFETMDQAQAFFIGLGAGLVKNCQIEKLQIETDEFLDLVDESGDFDRNFVEQGMHAVTEVQPAKQVKFCEAVKALNPGL